MDRSETIKTLGSYEDVVVSTNQVMEATEKNECDLGGILLAGVTGWDDDFVGDIFADEGLPMKVEFDEGGVDVTIPNVYFDLVGTSDVVNGRIEYADLSDLDVQVFWSVIQDCLSSEDEVARLDSFLSAQAAATCYLITGVYPDLMREDRRATVTTHYFWCAEGFEPELAWDAIYPGGEVLLVEVESGVVPYAC